MAGIYIVNSIPAGTVGGDLFEYVNFQQRYNILAKHWKSSPSFTLLSILPLVGKVSQRQMTVSGKVRGRKPKVAVYGRWTRRWGRKG